MRGKPCLPRFVLFRFGGGETVEKHLVSAQGVDIYTYENPNLNGFYISLFTKGGSIYEDEKYSGIIKKYSALSSLPLFLSQYN